MEKRRVNNPLDHGMQSLTGGRRGEREVKERRGAFVICERTELMQSASQIL
jgi:hypothetical protein